MKNKKNTSWITVPAFMIMFFTVMILSSPSNASTVEEINILTKVNNYSKYKIVDGDTFKLFYSDVGEKGKWFSFRPSRWDTPEYYMSMKMAWDSYHSHYSTDVIRITGKMASVKFKSCIEKYGIKITSFIIDGYSEGGRSIVLVNKGLSRCMVKSGYAYANDNDPLNSSRNKRIINFLMYAESRKLGLWGSHYDLMTRFTKKSLD